MLQDFVHCRKKKARFANVCIRSLFLIFLDGVPLSTDSHTFLEESGAVSSPWTAKTIDEAVMIPLVHLPLNGVTLPRHLAAIGMTTPAFSAWVSSSNFSSPLVPLPTYRLKGTPWILSFCQASFCSKPMMPRSTVLAALIMTSSYFPRFSTVHISVVTPEIVPLSFRLTSRI